MKRRLSIRSRIVLGSTAVVIALLAVASIAVYAQISSIAVAREKAVLHGIAEVYRGIILEDPNEPFEKPGIDQHVAVIAPDGTIKMDSLPKRLSPRIEELTVPGPTLREISDGETYFVYVDTVETPEGAWTVIATRESDIASGIVSRVVTLLWILLIGSAVLFAAGSWVVATAALRPVERLRRGAEQIATRSGSHDLLPVGGTRDEIDSLARTLNSLIEDVRASGAREQQMVENASHELRNPLTVLRAQLELLGGADAEADRMLLTDAKNTLNRLIRLAQTMLELSRIEAGPANHGASLAALADELTERVDHVRWQLAEPGSDVHGTVDVHLSLADPDAHVRLSADDFAHLVDNLIDNALRASDGEPARVEVELRAAGDELTLEVTDDGPGFDPRVIERAFERFSRGDASTYPGGGLGLAIVARIAELAGGAVAIDADRAVGAAVSIRVPIVGAASDFSALDVSAAPAPRAPNTHHR